MPLKLWVNISSIYNSKLLRGWRRILICPVTENGEFTIMMLWALTNPKSKIETLHSNEYSLSYIFSILSDSQSHDDKTK